MLSIGDKAPAFILPGNNGQELRLSEGTATIVYFYPKDDTPGCTTEAIEFSAAKDELEKLGVTIIGMSPDTAAKHDKFSTKHDLSIALASDESKQTLEAYGVWKEKSMYGKTYMGVERSTFLIGGDGKILEIWRKVRVKGHVAAVIESARQHIG